MGFLSPWFLGGLLAVGLPVYIHLLRQHKTVPLPFSSLMFFERRTQSSVKHRRLKYIALLIMRLLIIILLALLFANPFIRRTTSASGGRKLLVVAVDNSFSMRAGDRLERAKRTALDALSSFRPGDRGQVLAFAARTELMTPQPTEDVAELRSAIQAIQPGDGKSAYGEVSRFLRALATPSGPPVEAHIVSDMQKTSLPSPFTELALGVNTTMKLHAVAGKTEANWFVESVKAPPSIYSAKQTKIQATVSGSGAPAAEFKVALSLNGRDVSAQTVKVPANGRAAVEFFLTDAPYGPNRGAVRIESRDTLPQDDSFAFALERKEPSQVLFLHEARQPRSVFYFRSALDAVPESGFEVQAMQPEAASNLDLNRYTFVVLSDLSSVPENLESRLKDYVRRGNSVLVSLGAAAAARGRVPVLDEPIVESRYASREGERFHAVSSTDKTHPALSRVNDFEGVKFYQAVRVDPKGSKQLARLSDGVPLLLERQLGSGKALLFTSTLDNISNDLPLSPSFIPFVEQLALYLSGNEGVPPSYPVDSFVELRAGKNTAGSVEIVAPGGARPLSLKDAAEAQTYRVTQEGFFEIRRGNARNELIAVHADRRESDLTTIEPETLALWRSSDVGSDGQSFSDTPGERPVSLWWYFALALLIATVAESLFAGRYLEPVEEQPMLDRKAA